MKYIIRFIILCLSLYGLSVLLPGFSISPDNTVKVILVTALLLVFINTFIKPILKVLTLPISIITLGLFSIVLNTCILLGVAWYVNGFEITSFTTGLIATLVLSFIHFLLERD